MTEPPSATHLLPHVGLSDRVSSFEVVESNGGTRLVLPSTAAVIGLQLYGRVRTPDQVLSPAGITGIQDGARQYADVGPTRSLLVRFTPQGATSLGVPASELVGHSVGLDELFDGARARELRERFLEAGTTQAAVEVVQRFLLGLPLQPDTLVARAVELLDCGADEDARVAEVARSLGISERQLERRFRSRVGISPKRFVSLRRFERAAAMMRSARSLTQVAVDAGYFDQSHFIREVRRFAGMSPRRLRDVGFVQVVPGPFADDGGHDNEHS